MSEQHRDTSDASIRRLGAIGAALVGVFSVGVAVFVFVGTATASGTGLFTRTQVLQLEAALTAALLLTTACGAVAVRLWRPRPQERPGSRRDV